MWYELFLLLIEEFGKNNPITKKIIKKQMSHDGFNADSWRDKKTNSGLSY